MTDQNTQIELVHCNVEWCCVPSIYGADFSIYADKIAEARNILKTTSIDEVKFYYVGEAESAKFYEYADDEAEQVAEYINDYDGTTEPLKVFDLENGEITWRGPHLIVTDTQTQLAWYSKHSDDEMFVFFDIENPAA